MVYYLIYYLLIRIKRKRKKEKIENILSGDWIKTHSKEDLTEVTIIFSINSTDRELFKLHSEFV